MIALPALRTVLVAVGLISLRSFAQIPPGAPVDQLRRPSEVPLPVPEIERAPLPPLRAPAQPSLQPAPSLSGGPRVNVRAFRFIGNTAVTDAELQGIAAPFIGRELGALELDDLRVRLTRRYTDQGYINSGAVIPDQDVADGVVTLRIIEGRLSEIAIGGRNRYDPERLRERIGLGARGVLNVDRLQEHMQVMLQDPLIERISAELAPGAEPGTAVLRADVDSAPLFLGGITLTNERSPAIGADQIEALLAVRNLFGRGEIVSVRPGYTDGLRDMTYDLAVPLSARGTLLSARVQRTRSRIIETPLDQLDISARARSIEVGLTHPLVARPRRSLNAAATLAQRRTDSFFLGEPSPFIPGAPDGRTTVSVLRVGVDGVDRTPERVVAGRLQLSHGIDAFGATVAPGVADSRFTSALAQLQWVQRVLSTGGHLVMRAELQRANDALLGLEKYSLGGAQSVRGYRKDLLVRDNGWFASIEYRHLLGHLPWSSNAGSGDGPIDLALFADTGRAWDHDAGSRITRISSIGPGLRWEPLTGIEWQAYYGKALNNVATPTRTSQDRGVHIRLTVTRAF